jgi:hypothetical protein
MAVAMFGHTGLGMLMCRVAVVVGAHAYALNCIFTLVLIH